MLTLPSLPPVRTTATVIFFVDTFSGTRSSDVVKRIVPFTFTEDELDDVEELLVEEEDVELLLLRELDEISTLPVISSRKRLSITAISARLTESDGR